MQMIFFLCVATMVATDAQAEGNATDFTAKVSSVTSGPKNHFFGYIGHVRTIPWNASGRYIVALQTDFQNRMPRADDAADIILIDTQKDNAIEVIEHTRAWNFQQGTMLYWNPRQAETQFFFNDRDAKTGKVFAVLYDIAKRQRVREFKMERTPVGNSGVMQAGGWFCGLNYGRMARLRLVTGYPAAFDWTAGVKHPADDGVFKINADTGEAHLLVSFQQLAEALRSEHPEVDAHEMFFNHTLWNREGDRVFFFARGGWRDGDAPEKRLNVPCVMHADGSGLRMLKHFIGGHPDWDSGHVMVGQRGGDQILYDTDTMDYAGTLGSKEMIPNAGGDVAVSPDGKWFVNGSSVKGRNDYTILRRADGAWLRVQGMDQKGVTKGDLRSDPGPCWNRDGTQILFSSIADDPGKTRQLYLIRIEAGK